MDGFSFIFNNEGLFNFKDNGKKEETATKLEKNGEVETLKHNIHTKNQIILQLLTQCDAYLGIVTEIIKSASTVPDIDIKKMDDVSKGLNTYKKMNEMLKMAIEFEEMMEK